MFLPLIFASIISDLVLVLFKKKSQKKEERKVAAKKKIVVLRKLEKKGERSVCWFAPVLNFHIKLCN